MPAYCSAVNCKSNGIANPDLSFFQFPDTREATLDKWITAMRRKNWRPTKHSRLCSIHFDESCFFLRKGTRLRLLPDSVPSIFDFRKIKTNRKKAEEYLDMNETDCPDPKLYELETMPVKCNLSNTQKCFLCDQPANCDITTNSMCVTEVGRVSISRIISSIAADTLELNPFVDQPICLSCSKKLINSHEIKCKILDKFKTINNDSKEEVDNYLAGDEKLTIDSTKEIIIYCMDCDENFTRPDIGQHLETCKMKMKADDQNIPIDERRLFVCGFCFGLVYRHNAAEHVRLCTNVRKKSLNI